MKPARRPHHPDSAQAARSVALRWLAGLELSEAQVRQRLARRGYTTQAIEQAASALVEEGIIDDRRAATTIARLEATVRRHGPRRVMGRLIAMQIDRDLASEVVERLYEEGSQDTFLEEVLDRRLRGHSERLRDPGQRRKLVAFLVRRGFSASAASGLIRKRLRQKYNSE